MARQKACACACARVRVLVRVFVPFGVGRGGRGHTCSACRAGCTRARPVLGWVRACRGSCGRAASGGTRLGQQAAKGRQRLAESASILRGGRCRVDDHAGGSASAAAAARPCLLDRQLTTHYTLHAGVNLTARCTALAMHCGTCLTCVPVQTLSLVAAHVVGAQGLGWVIAVFYSHDDVNHAVRAFVACNLLFMGRLQAGVGVCPACPLSARP